MLRRSVARAARCAVFGGAFDPPTTGHLTCVRQVLGSHLVDEVVVVPCGPRTDKPGMRSVADRLAMVRLAVRDGFGTDARVSVSDIECREPEGMATYDLLQKLSRESPHNQYSFVIGSDWLQGAANIATWPSREGRTGHKLIRDYDFLVVPRLGYTTSGDLARFGPRFKWATHTAEESVDISSTEIREALQNGTFDSLERLVPHSVVRYIKEKGLYL